MGSWLRLRAANARGEIAISIRRSGQEGKPGGGVELIPGRDERLRLNEDDELIVLTTCPGETLDRSEDIAHGATEEQDRVVPEIPLHADTL